MTHYHLIFVEIEVLIINIIFFGTYLPPPGASAHSLCLPNRLPPSLTGDGHMRKLLQGSNSFGEPVAETAANCSERRLAHSPEGPTPIPSNHSPFPCSPFPACFPQLVPQPRLPPRPLARARPPQWRRLPPALGAWARRPRLPPTPLPRRLLRVSQGWQAAAEGPRWACNAFN